jgi:hypothetical protein
MGSIALTAASLAISGDKRMLICNLIISLVATAMWIGAMVLDGPPFSTIGFRIAALSLAFLFIANTMLAILRHVFSSPVTGNKICGAVCVYLLIGLAFAMLHIIGLAAHPDSYKFPTPNSNREITRTFDEKSELVYFSFCTLSTVGYGDITPTSRFSRTLSWMESVVGQLYLSILVARLVGLYLADEVARKVEADIADGA